MICVAVYSPTPVPSTNSLTKTQGIIGKWPISCGKNAPNIRLIITDYVFDELVTLVMTKLGKSYAIRMGERLRSSEFCSVVKVEQEDLKAAWEVFCQYRDK